MTLKKETMEWKQLVETQASQILLEGDMIVPDSKPDLQEILRCTGEARLREKRITDGRISFSGEMDVAILYCAKGGEKPLYAMMATLPLEDFLHMDGLEKDMEVFLSATVEHLNCEIINDRKIGVKAVLQVVVKAWKSCCAELLTGVSEENVEVLTGTLQTDQEIAAGKERFTVKEEWNLPTSMPEIGEILLENIYLTEQELHPVDGKAQVRGKLLVELLYADEEGKLGCLTEKIPFSGYMELDGVTSKTKLSGKMVVIEHRLQPSIDEDGECRRIAMDATVETMLRGKERKETEILLDAYMPEGNLVLQKEEIEYPLAVAEGENQFMLKERIKPEKGGMLHTEAIWGQVHLLGEEILPDAIEVEGVLQVEILYHSTEEGAPLEMLRQGIPFRQTMESKGVRPGDAVEISLRVEDLDFQMLSEGEGELRATIVMDGAAIRQEKAEIVTDMVLEEAECEAMPGASIYMVKKGDSLWKIAKKYRTTVADVLAVNEIDDPALIYPGQKVLIIRMKR